MSQFFRTTLVLILLSIAGCGDARNANELPGGLAELEKGPRSGAANLIASFGFAPSKEVAAIVAFYDGKRYFSGDVTS